MRSTPKIGIALFCIAAGFVACKTTTPDPSSKTLASGGSNVELAIALLDNLSIGQCKFTITRDSSDPKRFQVNFFNKGKLSHILNLNDHLDVTPTYPTFGEDQISYGPSRYFSSISNYNLLTLKFQGAYIYGPLQTRWIEVWFPTDGSQPKDARVTARRIPPGGLPIGGSYDIECKAD